MPQFYPTLLTSFFLYKAVTLRSLSGYNIATSIGNHRSSVLL